MRTGSEKSGYAMHLVAASPEGIGFYVDGDPEDRPVPHVHVSHDGLESVFDLAEAEFSGGRALRDVVLLAEGFLVSFGDELSGAWSVAAAGGVPEPVGYYLDEPPVELDGPLVTPEEWEDTSRGPGVPLPLITHVSVREPYLLDFELDDGRSGTLDLAGDAEKHPGSWFSEIYAPEAFPQVRSLGTKLEWPGGQDLCIHALLTALDDAERPQ